MGQNIQFKNGQVIVPDQPVIPFIEGDGIGKDITEPSQRVLNAAVAAAYGNSKKLVWKEVLAGKKAFDLTGSYLPDETLEAFKQYLVGIKGPLETPVGRRNPFVECCFAPNARFICLSASDPLV